MPETRAEKLLFAAGLCAILALATLIAFAGGGESATTSVRPKPRPVAHTTPSRPPSTTAVRTSPEPARRRSPGVSRQTKTVSLRLTAARSDSWMEIRSGSPQGQVLYVGILPQGDSRTFREAKVWARFGNAGNVDASLNGRALPLEAGTYSALITPQGVTDVSAG